VRRLRDLFGCGVEARDGSIGKVRDAFMDDARWAVRYLAVDTGGWLDRHEVLISPAAVERVDWDGWLMWLRLTRAQVEGSPDVEAHRPVSRQHELQFAAYYGWPQYWEGAALWGLTMAPSALIEAAAAVHGVEAAPEPPPGDRHLHSAREVIGYHIQATDGEIGHVEDFMIEDGSWAVRSMVVGTRNWLPGRRVLVPTDRIREFRWGGACACVDLTRDEVAAGPEAE